MAPPKNDKPPDVVQIPVTGEPALPRGPGWWRLPQDWKDDLPGHKKRDDGKNPNIPLVRGKDGEPLPYYPTDPLDKVRGLEDRGLPVKVPAATYWGGQGKTPPKPGPGSPVLPPPSASPLSPAAAFPAPSTGLAPVPGGFMGPLNIGPTGAAGKSFRTGPSNTLVGTNTGQFRQDALAVINADPNHPLRFLLKDGNNTKFGRTKGLGHSELIDDELVQMGHWRSNKAGGAERVVLQDAWSNQMDSQSVEAAHIGGEVLEKPVVDVGGIAVDKRSAVEWENNGRLPFGTVANAAEVDMHATLPSAPAPAAGAPIRPAAAAAGASPGNALSRGAANALDEVHIVPSAVTPTLKARLGGAALGALKGGLKLGVLLILGWLEARMQARLDEENMKRDWEEKIVPRLKQDLEQTFYETGDLNHWVDMSLKTDPLSTLYLHVNYRRTTTADWDPDAGGGADHYFGMEYVGMGLGLQNLESQDVYSFEHYIGSHYTTFSETTSIPIVDLATQVLKEASDIGAGLSRLHTDYRSVTGQDDPDLQAAARELFSFTFVGRRMEKKAAGEQLLRAMDRLLIFRQRAAFRLAAGAFGSPAWHVSDDTARWAARLSDLSGLFQW